MKILELIRLLSYMIVVFGAGYISIVFIMSEQYSKAMWNISVGLYFLISLVIVILRIYELVHLPEPLVLYGYTPVIIMMAISMILYMGSRDK